MKKKQPAQQQKTFIVKWRVEPRQRHNMSTKATRAGMRAFVPKGHDGICDLYGYKSSKVQSVVKRWKKTIGEQQIKDMFPKIARAACDRTPPPENLTPLGMELNEAIRKVYSEDSLTRWLLSCGIGSGTNERFDSWKEIQDQIKKSSGHIFTVVAIRQTAKRLGLTMSPAEAARYFKHRSTLFPPQSSVTPLE